MPPISTAVAPRSVLNVSFRPRAEHRPQPCIHPSSPPTFMSISPTDAHRSAPSPELFRNPSPGHGIREPIEPMDLGQIEAHGGGTDAPPPVSAPGPLANERSGLTIYGESRGSSYNVIGHNSLEGIKGSYGETNTTISHQVAGRGGLSSQFRSSHIGSALNSRPLGSASLQADHLTSGSNGVHVRGVQPAPRRNQSVSGNHLLKFNYDPISTPQPRIPPPRRQHKIKPYNKDLFLQANFKFVVLNTGNYQLDLMDPDEMLQWKDVVCVRYSTPFPVHCPICLESPLCPQITSCGHIYCFPCILQYLLMGEEDRKGECWKKCPLCFMMLSSKDLYTISIDNVKKFHVGDHAYFTLLTRAKDSLFPSLKNQLGGVDLMTDNSDAICDSFSKFVLTSDVALSVREAELDLKNWLCKAESGLVDDLEKLPYVCAALQQLEERMKNWMENQISGSSLPLRNSASPPSNLKFAHNQKKTQSDALSQGTNIVSGNLESAGSTSPKHERLEYTVRGNTESSIASLESSIASLASASDSNGSPEEVMLSNYEGVHLKRGTDNSKGPIDRDSYTFYQGSDGQHLILHPLNMKCLLYHYGSYDMLPQRINGEILELETVTQTEAMRRRYRFLSHFSLTTTFQLCEIDLSEILPPESLAPFMDEIKKRIKQRKRLARKEEDEKARAEAAALPDWPTAPNQGHLSRKDALFSPEDFTALGNYVAPSTSPPLITSERKLFSSVTRLGFAAAHDSPSLRAEEPTDPSGEKTGEASSLRGPSTTPSLSFASIISSVPENKESPETRQTNGSGRKGKKATKVLLSTAGGRRY